MDEHEWKEFLQDNSDDDENFEQSDEDWKSGESENIEGELDYHEHVAVEILED